MRKKNPSYTERQRRFMCAEYGRKKAHKRTKTKMTLRQLRDMCKKPLAKSKRKRNPHLGGAYTFLGMVQKSDIRKIKRGLKAHGIGGIRITPNHVNDDARYAELYVGRAYDAGQMRMLVHAILRGR